MITAPAVSVALLIGVIVMRFALDTDGIMLLAIVPIVHAGNALRTAWRPRGGARRLDRVLDLVRH